MKVNEIIKNRRKELGLTLKDVANELNVSESLISRYLHPVGWLPPPQLIQASPEPRALALSLPVSSIHQAFAH